MAQQIELTSFACGCSYDGGSEERNDGPGLTYCPLHSAAPALLEALERITKLGTETPAMGRFAKAQGIAYAAIAQAREEPAHPTIGEPRA